MRNRNKVPNTWEFVEEDFYSLVRFKDGKYGGCKRRGLKDFDRGIIYEDNEQLIWSDEKYTAFDLATGLEICKEYDFNRLYLKVTDMYEKIREMRKTDRYKEMEKIYIEVLNVLDFETNTEEV